MSQLRKDEELADMTRKSKICVQWMEEKLGAPLPNPVLREALLDGVVLCKLANILKPGCIRQFHRQPRMLMMKMENIAFFLTACKTRLSVPQATLFAPTDVHDDSDPANMLKVLRVLLLLRGDFPGTSTEEAVVGEFEEPDEIAEPSPDDLIEPSPAVGGEDAALSAASAAAAAAKAAAEAAMAQAAALQAEAEAARAAAAAAAETRRIAAEKAERERAEKAERDRIAAAAQAEKERLDREHSDRIRQQELAASSAAAAEKAAAAERALAAAEKAAADRAAAAAAAKSSPALSATSSAGGAASSASADYLSGYSSYDIQPEIISEITSAINSELSLESKNQLLANLTAHVRAAQAKIMSASDSELRTLCFESGLGATLAAVPTGKPRSWYVEWLLKHGRIGS